MDIDQSILLALCAFLGSVFGSMLGLGGGVFIVPLFTLALGVDPKVAIAASAICVVANSVIGSLQHVRNEFVNVRLSLVMEVTTAMGAIVGAMIAVRVNADLLKGLLGIVLLYAAYSMLQGRKAEVPNVALDSPDPMKLMWEYHDQGKDIRYLPQRLNTGLGVGVIAGILSGLLGIGGGLVKVPVMNLIMRIPLRAAAGTSSFMVGMTAAASALVFYATGHVDPKVTAPALVGVLAGSTMGSVLTKRFKIGHLIVLFVIVVVVLGLNMIMSAFGISLF